MWSRVVELMLGVWLCLSPFIFLKSDYYNSLCLLYLSSGSLVICISFLSFLERHRHLHFLTALSGLLVAAVVFLYGSTPPPPQIQNLLVTGLLLAMFGVLPNHSQLPPAEWRQFYKQKEKTFS